MTGTPWPRRRMDRRSRTCPSSRARTGRTRSRRCRRPSTRAPAHLSRATPWLHERLLAEGDLLRVGGVDPARHARAVRVAAHRHRRDDLAVLHGVRGAALRGDLEVEDPYGVARDLLAGVHVALDVRARGCAYGQDAVELVRLALERVAVGDGLAHVHAAHAHAAHPTHAALLL